jgi:amidase
VAELWELDATDQARLIRTGRASAREAVASALARLEAVNPHLNAVVQAMPEEALAAADAVDAAVARGEDPGVLAGVPVTVKVNVDQAGHATTNGIRIQAGHRATEDNPVVANFRKAGAVIIGRTNTPAFSVRWFCSNLLHGATWNPHGRHITPGGSSGGAGSAVASGIGAIGHGTDIGGSVRYPAYANGVHGLRPSIGRIPAWNPSLPDRDIGGQLMSVSGPLARSMADLRLALAAMSAADPRDPWHVPMPLEGPALPRRAALCIAPEGMPVSAELKDALRAAAARLADAGWAVEEVAAPPPLREPARLQAQLWMCVAQQAVMAAVRRENEPAALAVHEHIQRLVAPPNLAELHDGLTARQRLVRAWNLFLGQYPVVLMPVSGELPFPNEDDRLGFERFAAMWEAQLTQLAIPFLGLPGLAVGTGMAGDRPVGVQLVGPRYREDVLLAAGEVITGEGMAVAPVTPAWA